MFIPPATQVTSLYWIFDWKDAKWFIILAALQSPACSNISEPVASPLPLVDAGHQTLVTKFSDLLEQGLNRAVQQITMTIKADLQRLCASIDAVEYKLEATVARMNQNTVCIESLQQQLEQPLVKIDD